MGKSSVAHQTPVASSAASKSADATNTLSSASREASLAQHASAVTDGSREVFQGLFQGLGKQAMAMEAILRRVCGKVDSMEGWMTEISFGMTELDLKLRNIAHNIEGTAANVDDEAASAHRWAAPPEPDSKPSRAAATVKKKLGADKMAVKVTGMVASIMDTLGAPVEEHDNATKKKSLIAAVAVKKVRKKKAAHHPSQSPSESQSSAAKENTGQVLRATEEKAQDSGRGAGNDSRVHSDPAGETAQSATASEVHDPAEEVDSQQTDQQRGEASADSAANDDIVASSDVDSDRPAVGADGGVTHRSDSDAPEGGSTLPKEATNRQSPKTAEVNSERHTSKPVQPPEDAEQRQSRLAPPAEREQSPQEQAIPVTSDERVERLPDPAEPSPQVIASLSSREPEPPTSGTDTTGSITSSSPVASPKPTPRTSTTKQTPTVSELTLQGSTEIAADQQVSEVQPSTEKAPLTSGSLISPPRRPSEDSEKVMSAAATKVTPIPAPPADTETRSSDDRSSAAPDSEDSDHGSSSSLSSSSSSSGTESDSPDDEDDEATNASKEPRKSGPDASSMTRTITALKKLKKANMLTAEEADELKYRAQDKWHKLKGHMKEKKKKDVANILLKRKKNVFTVSARIELLEEKSKVHGTLGTCVC